MDRNRPSPPCCACEALEPRTLLSGGAPVRFAVVGDFGSNNQQAADVAARLKSWLPEFVLTVGDNNYDFGQAETIDANIGQYYAPFIGNYTGAYGPGSTVNRFFPTLGNHDWDNGLGAQPYTDYFTLPGNERYYDFVRGPVHFFAVSSDAREPDGTTPGSVQGQWLQGALAASTSPWNVVYFHHPPYSSGNHGDTPHMQWPFKQWGADLILTGHDHDYERMLNPTDGLTYVVNGLGGMPLIYGYPFNAPGTAARFNADWGAMTFTATDEQLAFWFITRAGEVADAWALNSSAQVPAPATGATATTVSGRQVNVAWADGSGNESGFRVERSYNGGAFEKVAEVGPNVTRYADLSIGPSGAYAYRVVAYNTAGPAVGTVSPAAVTVADGTPGLPAPATVTATPASANQVNVSWAGVPGAGAYTVEVSTDGFVYTPLPAVAGNVTGVAVTGLAPGALCFVRVKATGAAGDSPFRYGSATTPAFAAPATPDLDAASDSGASDTDNLTNAATVTFRGTAAAGSTVRLYRDGVEIGSGSVAGGAWSVEVALPEGTHAITARAFDGTAYSAASAALTVVVDRTPPRVDAVRYNSSAAATANVRRIGFAFSEAVVAAASHLVLNNLSTGQGVSVAAEGAAAAAGGGWTFPGYLHGLPPNGNYAGTLSAGVADGAGNFLDGNGDGVGGDAKSFAFYQLAGDANGDRVVNNADFRLLYAAFGTAGAPAVDFDGDGGVTFTDFLILEANFGKSVAAPVQAIPRPPSYRPPAAPPKPVVVRTVAGR